jgi:hypothetical protein
LEIGGRHGSSAGAAALAKQIVLNPMVLSTLLGLAWAIAGLPLPAPLVAYIFAGALTPCALFAIGLGLSVEGVLATSNAAN